MTPREYIDQLGTLITAERYDDALELAERNSSDVMPKLSAEDLFHVCGMMEMAQLAVDTTNGLDQLSASGPHPAVDAPSLTAPGD